MKKDLHPKNYRLVAFKDMSNGETFLTRSTANTRETITMEDGVEYPLVKKVLDTLLDYNVSRFSLVTNLEAVEVKLTEAKN